MVYKKILIFLIIGCYIAVVQGCYASRQITHDQLEAQEPLFIRRIVTVDNKVHDFPDGSYAFTQDSMIIVKTPDGEYMSFPRDQVLSIHQYGLDDKKTCLYASGCGTAGILAAFVAVILFAVMISFLVEIGKSTGEY